MTCSRSVIGRGKAYVEELNEENESRQRVKEVTIVDQEVPKISQAEEWKYNTIQYNTTLFV